MIKGNKKIEISHLEIFWNFEKKKLYNIVLVKQKEKLAKRYNKIKGEKHQ